MIDKYFALSNLSIYYMWKNIKKLHKTTHLKYELQCKTKNLNYQMNHIELFCFRYLRLFQVYHQKI